MIHLVTKKLSTALFFLLLQKLYAQSLREHVTNKASTICFENSATACISAPDGIYPACPPTCSLGFYYSCSGKMATTRMCPAGTLKSGGVAPLVFDVMTGRCKTKSLSCQKIGGARDTSSKNRKRCISNSPSACKMMKDGDYPSCEKNCQQGAYYTCKTNTLYPRFCPFAWHTDFKNWTYLVALAFDGITRRCQFGTKSCPRDLRELEPAVPEPGVVRNETCIANHPDTCKYMNDGKYEMCRPICAMGAFIYCLGGVAYFRYCPTHNYPGPGGLTIVARGVFSTVSGHCVKSNIRCPHELDFATTGNDACMSQNAGACIGLPTADYAACAPFCTTGLYFSCVHGKQISRSCPQGWYRKDGKNFLAPLTYSPETKTCDYSTPTCPRDEDKYLS